jgi:hypothetical protein
VSRRIWLDITGIHPGSDAAVFALCLDAALRRAGADVQPCHRTPGMQALGAAELTQILTLAADEPALPPVLQQGWGFGARRLPERTRVAIGHFLRLQKAAMAAWRGLARAAITARHPEQMPDLARPNAGDVLLMLCLSGDAARFAANGVLLVLLATDTTVLARPEWRTPEEVAQAEIWRRTTLPLVAITAATSDEGLTLLTQAGAKRPILLAGAADAIGALSPQSTHPRRFVLAGGEIGEAGQTRQLLLTWRRLQELLPADAVPDLVLAGPVEALSADVLEQLRNSRLLGGRARLVMHPGAELVAGLNRDCLFAIAPSPSSGWGRATWNALAAGAPCLSVFAAYGAVPFDAGNAAAVTARVRAWLADPPARPSLPRRDWDTVAETLLRELAR